MRRGSLVQRGFRDALPERDFDSAITTALDLGLGNVSQKERRPKVSRMTQGRICVGVTVGRFI
jgi:hypothetical protein